ncbi:MAG: cell division topological specificity factor MinE [Defluviitaleaceae bacterium]|nr:cell division topological specificity factor MinE [Defluviitaleaceae bacterium]
MISLFRKLAPSKDIARDRLKMILVTDRMDGSAHVLEMMKNDLLIVLKQYINIDDDEFDLHIHQQSPEGGEEAPRLKAEIPIKSMRRR